MRQFRQAVAVTAVLLGCASIAQAQSTPRRDQAYVSDLVTLSNIIGSAHGVRVVCNGRTDQYWRTFMQDLLTLEAPEQGNLRRSMAEAFNRGFSTVTTRHSACTDELREAENAYAARGQDISERLAAFYFARP